MLRKIISTLCCIVTAMQLLAQQGVGIGTTSPHASAALDITSTDKGLLVPRMTTAQRDAIVSPAPGLIILNLDDKCVDIYNGTGWIKNCGFTIVTDTTTAKWTRKTDFGGVGRSEAVGFSIGNKGYMGIGQYSGGVYKDFWEYDPLTNAWAQKADFGGVARAGAAGFSIGGKGYVGCGYDGTRKKDFWEYNPALNTWTQKADFGGSPRFLVVGFSINGKGYIGTGLAVPPAEENKDFWEYDPALDTWTQKADFGGTARHAATGFAIGSLGYIGTGFDGSSSRKDFWEYNPATDTWTQKTDFGGVGRYSATGLSMGSLGFIGLGTNGSARIDCWQYNTSTDTWTQIQNFPGFSRYSVTGFGIGSKGYVGAGYSGSGFLKDFWEYEPYPTVSSYSNAGNSIMSNSYNANGGLWIKTADSLRNAVTANRMVLDATNVGIGTSTPGKRLDVNGQARIGDHLIFNSASGVINWGSGGHLYFRTNPTQGDNNSFTDRMVLANNGFLGIGTSLPGARLDVNGTFRMTDGTQASGRVLTSDASGYATWQALPAGIGSGSATGNTLYWNGSSWANSNNIYNNNGNVGIGTASPGKQLDVGGTVRMMNHMIFNSSNGIINWSGAGNLYFRINNTTGDETNFQERMVLTGFGNLGIGTTNPTARLEVIGTFRLFDGTQGAGKVLTSNAFGAASWQTLPTEIAAGTTTGNTAYWNGTAWANSNNIFNNNANVGIGTATPGAKLDVAGTVKIADGSQGIGKVLTSDGDGLANWQTIPVQIGNGSATGNTAYWNGTTWANSNNIYNNNGNVGIGTASPSAKLDISGTFKMADGSEGIGKVLTSDAGGLANWQTLPTQIANGSSTGNTAYWNGSAWVNSDNIYNNNGNVGIGTNNPQRKLDVNGIARIATHLIFNSGSAVINYSAAGHLFFRSNAVQGDDATYTERMILTSGGNLGIGTTTPANRLSVVGNANITGNAYVTGTFGIGTGSPITTLDVEGGIRTRYSGTLVGGFAAGTSTVNIPINPVGAGWDYTNAMILMTNADGVPGTVLQAKLTSNSNIQLTYNATANGTARLHYIVFKL